MNINTFESFLDKEFKEMFPLTILDNDVILYKKFKIKSNKVGHWVLSRLSGDVIHTFKLKSTAILAANYYSNYKYKKVEHLKLLDADYWNKSNDVSFFKARISQSNDPVSKDIFLSRLSSASDKKKQLKKEIIKLLKVDF